MKRYLSLFVGITLLTLSSLTLANYAQPNSSTTYDVEDLALSEAIQQSLSTLQKRRSVYIAGSTIVAAPTVAAFYQGRSYVPAWHHKQRLSKHAKDLLQAISKIDELGLDPSRYHHDAISTTQDLVARELLLTDAYILYVTHIVGTNDDPRLKKLMWQRRGDEANVVYLLEEGLRSRSLKKHLSHLYPKESGHKKLQELLTKYRKIAARGGWSYVSPGGILRVGDQGPRVRELRERLKATGEISSGGDHFDSRTEAAVRKFQRRHGIAETGDVGKKTLAALNIPVEARIRQIAVNMYRRRMLPDELGNRHIVVNIPEFRLHLFEKERPILNMNVVVGKATKEWQTRPLVSEMTHLILNPRWNVPRSIFKKELLRKIKKDPSYLSRNNMKVIKTSKNDLDISNINWAELKGNEDIRIVQRSGRGNALGNIKFMFPNPYSIYLHDTQAKSLFKRSHRAFSHGCVRVAQPLDLAETLLNPTREWSRHEITGAIASGVNRTVNLDEPVNLYVQYWTAWVDAEGQPQFRDDIYRRDTTVSHILGI